MYYRRRLKPVKNCNQKSTFGVKNKISKRNLILAFEVIVIHSIVLYTFWILAYCFMGMKQNLVVCCSNLFLYINSILLDVISLDLISFIECVSMMLSETVLVFFKIQSQLQSIIFYSILRVNSYSQRQEEKCKKIFFINAHNGRIIVQIPPSFDLIAI